jgi:hypothetical protein
MLKYRGRTASSRRRSGDSSIELLQGWDKSQDPNSVQQQDALSALNDLGANKISMGSIKLLHRIGAGSSGQVWAGKFSGLDVAVKVLIMQGSGRQLVEKVEEVEREVRKGSRVCAQSRASRVASAPAPAHPPPPTRSHPVQPTSLHTDPTPPYRLPTPPPPLPAAAPRCPLR